MKRKIRRLTKREREALAKALSLQKYFTDRRIVKFAEASGMPSGWYAGPWFDDDDALREGVPPCLRDFVAFVVLASILEQ